jgi:hypothetical protein
LVLTVVGHLIWCFFAWLIRLATGPSQPAHAFGRLCPFCETWTTPSGGRCQCCGRDLASKPAEELADLHAMRRQIQRLAKAGRLTAAQLVEFHTVLETRELELRRPAGAVPAASSAVPPAAEPSHRAEVVPALPPSPAIPPTIGTKPDVRLDIVETPPVAPAKESLLAPAKESLLAPAATPAWVPERSTGAAADGSETCGAGAAC